jgi:hypothetical protein
MPKRMIVTIAYQRYACEPADAIRLLDIGSRLIHVERRYPEPFRPVADQAPLITVAKMEEVDDGPMPATVAELVEPPPAPTEDDEPF